MTDPSGDLAPPQDAVGGTVADAGGDTVSLTTSDGVRIAAHRLHRPRSGATVPTAVLAHAAGLHGRVFAPLAAGLSSDLCCVAPDLRGHGDSDAPPELDFDWRGFARDLDAVIDGLGLSRPFGVGHSSGATALLLAEQTRPGRFAALYLFEPVLVPADPPLGRDPDSWLAQMTRARRATFASRQEALRRYRERPPLSDLHPAVLRAYVHHGLVDDAEGSVRLKCRPEWEALVYELATAHDGFVHLDRVACPVTIAYGGRSEATCPRNLDAMTERLADVRTEEHPDLGHLGPLEDPDAVAAAIRRAFDLGGGQPPGR